MRQKPSSIPDETSACCTRSWSPTDAPPSVTSTSTLASRALANGGFQRAELIDRDAEIDRDASARLDNPGDGEIVGGDDLRRAQRPAGRDQFVAGRQDRHSGAAADGERRVVRRRRQRDVAGSEPAARREQGFAGAKVHAGRTQVVACRHGG